MRIDRLSVVSRFRRWRAALPALLAARVYVGRHLSTVPPGSLVVLPCTLTRICCGVAGIVAYKPKKASNPGLFLPALQESVDRICACGYDTCGEDTARLNREYLCGDKALEQLLASSQALKQSDLFAAVAADADARAFIGGIVEQLQKVIAAESASLNQCMGRLPADAVDTISSRLECLKDVAWCLSSEVLANVDKTDALLGDGSQASAEQLVIYKNINTVLNSIDRLEVRGRDSAGLSLMFILEQEAFAQLEAELARSGLSGQFARRCGREVLGNRDIGLRRFEAADATPQVSIAFTYKIAAEIGRLGDNVAFLREQIREDAVLRATAALPHRHHTILSHTRWASVGAITEANCHPVDNHQVGERTADNAIIHVCLNGDIDNYLELKAEHERAGCVFHGDVTTDTKVIPLQVEKYHRQGRPLEEAFRLAVNDFEGSHAICMHTDLAPGKLFLAQRGSGQTFFVGLAEDHCMPTSEVYGFVEVTPRYLKLDGEKTAPGKGPESRGQIFILDENGDGGLAGVQAMYYDKTPLALDPADIKQTAITSRDIDRQQYPHYFLKEISESPASVEKTLQNRWKVSSSDPSGLEVSLGGQTVPPGLRKALLESPSSIRRIYFVGQGTAGVAALACADILRYYLNDPNVMISALKASELSGFALKEDDAADSMADALVIAISQSGTTTDTNRAVDMVRERGAHTLAIVNRRDSDITFKADGVMYTSSGRDIEMSVASTKAFYSQIIAGALLGLYIAGLQQRRGAKFISAEIRNLLEIPGHMRSVLAIADQIGASARRLATRKYYWAAVGSGPNKVSADEIRIKLSELCYKTISSDYVEDKKHIDLSSEPLIIVCAAGTRGTVIGDIIKDTAIFKAHKAAPVVIADVGEQRFDPYAVDVFHVPPVGEHLAPILNTLVGHIWGYHAALSINEGSRFLYKFQESIRRSIDRFTAKGMDIYEIILEKGFKEKIVRFYTAFRRKKSKGRFPAIMGIEAAADLTLLLKYLAGRLPVSDFELDFGVKGTPRNMLESMFKSLGESINTMARPVDAIKHQAKTVTVGTSRISEKLEGLLFETLAAHGFTNAQLTASNILVLRNLQEIIAEIKGAIRYRIGNLNLLGEPVEETTIEVEKKEGVLAQLPSRVDTDTLLKGTKRIIVREGNVYIGKGRKDDRSILVIPVISTNPETPGIIEHLLLLNIGFKENIALPVKVKALGGKLERIKNIVQENSVAWRDEHLEQVQTDELFGRSAEKIGEFIVSKVV